MKFRYWAEKKSDSSKYWGVRKYLVLPTGGELREEIVTGDLDREEAYTWASKWNEEQADVT